MPSPIMTEHLTKTVPVKILETKTAKAADGSPLGIVRALFSAYGVKDYDGDVTRPGSFDPLIELLKAGDRTIPCVFAHNSWDLAGYVGVVTNVEETPEGPVSTSEYFLDDPEGLKAYRLAERRAVVQHSYQYDVLKSHIEEGADGEPINVLDSLIVYELGQCLRGANADTDVVDVKGRKAGRVLSAANEKALRDAVDQVNAGLQSITTVLDQVATTEPKNAGDQPDPAAEDPTGGNAADTKAHGTTAEDWAALKELRDLAADD